MQNKTFNIVIAGVGGQGLITLNNIIAQAALNQGYDVKTSELHGLSQRSGSVQTYIRIGKKVFSPLITEGGADLIFGLEIIEGLRASLYANSDTNFIINNNYVSFFQGPEKEKVIEEIKKTIKKAVLFKASEICQKELRNEVVSSVYLLGYAVSNHLIPIEKESVLSAIKNIVPEKYLDLNIKAFQLAYDK